MLDQWLDRNETYDAALAALYKALARSAARSPTRSARRSRPRRPRASGLPPDARGAGRDHGRHRAGRAERAVIAIEEAKAELADALEPEAAPSSDALSPTGPAAATLPATHRGRPSSADRPARHPNVLGGANTVQLRVVTDQPWEVARGRPRHPDRRRAGVRRTARRARSAHRRRASRARRVRRAEGQALLDGPRRRRRARRRPRAGGRHRRPRQARSRDRRAGRRRGRAPARRPDGPSARRLADAAGRRARRRRRGRRRARRPAAWSRAPTTRSRSISTRSESAPPELDELDPDRAGRLRRRARSPPAAERGVIIGEGANMARTLSNRAANDVSPEVLADEARAIAEKHGLWIDVIEPDRATELGMGMFMAVGRGSDNPPRMIVMRSGGEGRARRARSAPGDRRQGRLLRLGRHQHQAVRPDGRDEDGQDRRVHRDRGHRDGRAPGARHAAPRDRRRRSRTCPGRTRPGRATSSARSTARRSTSPTPTPRAG